MNQPNTSISQEKARKLMHQAVGAHESNIEDRTWHSDIKSIGIIVSRNYPITDYYKFLHDKNNQSDSNYNFLHGKNNQLQIFARIPHLQLRINCIPRNQSN